MLTILGLGLEYDRKYTATENLFLQLFGRLPKTDCGRSLAQKILLQLVGSVEHGQAVSAFFGLGASRITPSDRNVSSDFLENANAGLSEIREMFSDEVLALYEDFPKDLRAEEFLVQQLVDTKTKYRKLQKEYRCRVEADRMRN